VELMPIFDFDETTPLRTVDGKPLWNFWGYSTMGFFAPHSAYCVKPEEGAHLKEFRNAVKALHTMSASIASCGLRPGRNPYENPRKSSS
jgi:glycogen operon protein